MKLSIKEIFTYIAFKDYPSSDVWNLNWFGKIVFRCCFFWMAIIITPILWTFDLSLSKKDK